MVRDRLQGMKIAVIRGPSLNDWELQSLLPLTRDHEFLAIGSRWGHHRFNLDIKNKKLVCLGEIFSFIPGGINFLYHRFGDPQILLGLETAIKGYDIIHTAECANYYSYQSLEARREGLVKKMVVTCWENLAGLHEDYPAQRRIKKEVIREADHFLAVTEQAKRALITDGAQPEKITVIPMGVDLDKFRIKNKEFRIKNKKNLEILFVGRLVEEKGVWELLEAFKMAVEQMTEFNLRLRMAGSGPLRGKLVQKAWAWGISDKIIIEEKYYSEMPKIYHNADIFIMTSKPRKGWEEQFGMVLVEAMGSGLPIIATRTGAIPEVVGEAGILVEPGNISELTEAIKRIIIDRKLKETLSFKAHKRAEVEYNHKKIAVKIEKFYRKVLNG